MTTDSAPRLGPDDRPPLLIRYRNHRSEVAERRVLPHALRYGRTEWHPEPQWLLDAYDLDREASRTFAMRDILRWGEPRPGEAGEPAATDLEQLIVEMGADYISLGYWQARLELHDPKAPARERRYREAANDSWMQARALIRERSARLAALEAALAAAKQEGHASSGRAWDACSQAAGEYLRGIISAHEGRRLTFHLGRLGVEYIQRQGGQGDEGSDDAALAATPGGPREGAGEGAL